MCLYQQFPYAGVWGVQALEVCSRPRPATNQGPVKPVRFVRTHCCAFSGPVGGMARGELLYPVSPKAQRFHIPHLGSMFALVLSVSGGIDPRGRHHCGPKHFIGKTPEQIVEKFKALAELETDQHRLGKALALFCEDPATFPW